MNNYFLKILNRDNQLFDSDLQANQLEMQEIISKSNFLVIGGAGSIGQALVKELFRRKPKVLHVVDISENNLVELVRDLRSNLGYIDGDFQTFALDCSSVEFDCFLNKGTQYDYVLNLSALKHVRSEKDPYTLMRLIQVNILNTIKMLQISSKMHVKKYFCVSTDKAASPVNMMGASKRIMEMFLIEGSLNLPISMARFANVAFSDGSLLHGFNQRILKHQPISAPIDIQRYFITPQESGELCLMACLLGENRDIFFPKFNNDFRATTFPDIARRYLNKLGYEPFECASEDDARQSADVLIADNKWPCYFFESDTTGEKDIEIFYMPNELLDMNRFKSVGIIKNDLVYDKFKLENFVEQIYGMRSQGFWDKKKLIELFNYIIPEFNHLETGKYLDGRM